MPDFHRIAAICLLTANVLVGLKTANAQEERPREETAVALDEDGGPAVERVKTTIFVRDERNGELVPVPHLTLQDLARLKQLELDAHRPEDEPKYHFAEGTITGKVDADRVSLKIVYDIVVHETAWTRVALRLGGAYIVSAEFEGEGEHFLEYDDKEESYFARIRPAATDETHRLKIDVLTRAVDVGNEQRLELKLPRVIGSRSTPTMTLTVPVESAAGFAKAGSQNCPVEAKPAGKQTDLRIVQPGGDFSLVWRSTKTQPIKAKPVVFDANSKIIVTWDSQARVVWDAKIDLNVLQGQLTTATVRLPKGARLIDQEVVGQRVAVAEPTSDGASPSQVKVEFDRVIEQGQTGEIRLRCERQLDPRTSGAKTAPDIAGFEVGGAGRQSGYVGFVFASVWRANLGSMANVSRPYEMPAGFRDTGVSGSNTFRFLSQPFALQMSVSPRKRRVTTSSVFVLDLSPGRVSLEARLTYNVVGRHLDVCSAILPGWEIDGVSLIEGDTTESLAFDPPTEARLDVNLPREMRGEFELRISASQQIPDNSDFVVVNLPTIEDEQLGPPTLVVVADDDMQVRYDADRSTGLTQGSDVSELQLPKREYPVQVFEVGEESSASFAAELTMRPGEVVVASHATVSVARSSLAMEQILVYDVRHAPISAITLSAPAWWSTRSSTRITIDGHPVIVPANSTASENGRIVLTLPLQEPRIGNIELTLRYDVVLSELLPSEPTASTVSFAQPTDVRYETPFNVTIQAERHIDVGHKKGVFDAAPISGDLPSETLQLAAEEIPAECDLILTYQKHDAPRSTIIDRVWVQTWLTASGRQDRAVLRVLSNESHIALRLPPSVSANQLMLVVDGAGVSASPNGEGSVVLPLVMTEGPAGTQNGLVPHVIELGWRREEVAAFFKRAPFEMPIVQDAWVQHIRWHVVTPHNRVLLTAPSGMTGDLFGNLAWWQESSSIQQRDFELWAGASNQPSPESIGQTGSVQQYAFASVSSADGASVTSVNASFALLIGSCLALMGGVAFVFVRQLRHPGVIVALSLLLGVLAFTYPAIALFGGHAAVMVIIILVVARVLQMPFLRRQNRPTTRRSEGLSSVIGIPNSSRLRTDAALAVSPSTTTNVGNSLPVGSSNLK